MPSDPVNALDEAAIAMKAMFDAYLSAGFTEHQACTILGVQVAQAAKGSN